METGRWDFLFIEGEIPTLKFVYKFYVKMLKPESSIQSVPKEILIAWNKMKCTLTFNKKTVAKQVQRRPSLDLSGSSLFVLYEKNMKEALKSPDDESLRFVYFFS